MKELHSNLPTLKELLSDDLRNEKCILEVDGVVFDFTHSKVTLESLDILDWISKDMNVSKKIKAMMSGLNANTTENRPALHTALRMPRNSTLVVDGVNVIDEIWSTLDKIKSFSEKIRKGEFKGYSGKNIWNTVVIGIGGSFLGPIYAVEAMKFYSKCYEAAKGRNIWFLANVDPTDFFIATEGLDLEETLFVINSKTFTTAETMLNAKTVKSVILNHYKKSYPDEIDSAIVKCHFAACSTNLPETSKFGIEDENVFAFWNWVGGWFSVCSCIGMLPICI